MRSSMAHLVTRLRSLLPSSASSLLSDDALCEVLDDSSTLTQASPAHAIALPWETTFTRYASEQGDWEATPTVHDGTQQVAVSQFDLSKGEFVLVDANPRKVLYLAGRYVDMNAAAAQALERLAGLLSTEFDFASDDQRFSRSQQVQMILQAAAQFRKQAQARSVPMNREDLSGAFSTTD